MPITVITLIAVAALVATGAFAQTATPAQLNQPGMAVLPSSTSSLTIGGMIDAGVFRQVSATTGQSTVNVGSNTASRLRFVGVEDMGGGNKATFWLEMQPSVTDGTTGSAGLFNRGAWASLSGGWGEVRLGRMGTNTISAVIVPDIQQGGAFYGFYGGGFLFSGMGGPGAQGAAWFAANPTRGGGLQASGTTGNTTAQASSTTNLNQTDPAKTAIDSTRYNRAIRYSLPAMLNGTLTANITSAYGNTGNGAGGGSQGVDVSYNAGALRSTFAYQRAGAEAGSDATGSLTTLGVNYNFGSFILGGALQSEKASGTGIVFNSGRSAGLAAFVPMGAATPFIKIGSHSYDTLGTNTSMVNVGVTYSLSKKTLVFVDYARNGATNTGTAASGTVAAGNVVAAVAVAAPRLFSVGLQTNF
ncbi:MAG: porin [Cytophagales bacterium]|nr:porin [Cytophagales bacterium]